MNASRQLEAKHSKYMTTLEKLHTLCQAETATNLTSAALAHGISVPRGDSPPSDDTVDTCMVKFLSQLAESSALGLPDFIRLVRGQSTADPRPNKDLFEIPHPPAPDLHEACDRWNSVVRHGVIPEWLLQRPAVQDRRPSNHGTIKDHMPQVWRHIRKGQKDGRYLVVKASLADKVFISPIGDVDKAGTSPPDIRLINDYSHPDGAAVNDFTDRSHLPKITYNPPADIARMIFTLRRDHPYARILIMLGDVARAFRHVLVHADHAHMFAFVMGGFLVIDLPCGFGWCGSPAWYYLPGVLINGLYEHSYPMDLRNGLHEQSRMVAPRQPRCGSFWCDDHTCIEIGEGLRFVANLALRRAMATVLGPTAINENKFTRWSENGRALGLEWNTREGTVTIPADKIAKALHRVLDAITKPTVTKTYVLSLVGSLRHIATCCPPARAFFQRLQDVATAVGRYGRRRLPATALDDLKWFKLILQQHSRFNRIPVDHFAQVSRPTVQVHMDASNQGLCVIEPSLKQYIRVQFSQADQDRFTQDASTNSINIREFQSAVLAALLWGPTWTKAAGLQPVHVQFWIDNTSAVAWTQRRASRHPVAQLYNRLLSLAEFNYSLLCRAAHVPGEENVVADARSRAWASDDDLFAKWTNLSCGWIQVPVTPPYDDLSQLWRWCCNNTPSLNLPQPNIVHIGGSGPGSRVS